MTLEERVAQLEKQQKELTDLIASAAKMLLANPLVRTMVPKKDMEGFQQYLKQRGLYGEENKTAA